MNFDYGKDISTCSHTDIYKNIQEASFNIGSISIEELHKSMASRICAEDNKFSCAVMEERKT